MQHFEVQFQPDGRTVRVHRGATLLEAAGLVGIILTNPCGGIGRCGKCKVRLLPSEKDVLACQYTIEHDVEVYIPDTSRYFKQQILEHGINPDVLTEPMVCKISLENPSADPVQLCHAISQTLGAPCNADLNSPTVNQKLQDFGDTPLTAVIRQDTESGNWLLADLEHGDTTGMLFGLAVDIGTTSIVARLVNLITADVSSTVSASNPQAQYGADVISRIGFSDTPGGQEKLQQAVIACLNDLTGEASKEAGISPSAIYEVVIAGNTTMNHLLLGYPVAQLGQAPYEAHSVTSANIGPEQLSLAINPAGNIHTIANIAGFVGSDTVAAALACGMDICNTPTLLVDIGTNGEIVFGTKEHLIAASCAAGPALEGAGIEFGSRAQAGAIERVVLADNDIDVDVIGTAEAATICGSGLIDAVAVMLELEIIDTTGRFAAPEEMDPFVSTKIRRRLITYQDEPAFVLAGQLKEDAWHNTVMLTQKDVRQLQLAKAAIRAGITLLLKAAGQTENQIQQILLAGAFGNYIQKENAVRIGLLPQVAKEKIHFVGNAAGSGAHMALTSQPARNLADTLAEQIEYLEIAHKPEFQMIFSDCLLFPEK